MTAKTSSTRPFWQDFLIVIGCDVLGVLAISALLRSPEQISNLFFLSSVVLLVIAVIPAFGEFASNARLAGRAIKKGDELASLLKEQEPNYRRGARTTYLYGFASVVAFLLSLFLG